MATGNESLSLGGGQPLPTFTTALQSLRARWRELLRAQSDRLAELESRLEQQFVDGWTRMDQQPREIGDCEQELFDKVETLEREIRRLSQLRLESEQALDEAQSMLSELEKERRDLREQLDMQQDGSSRTEPAAAVDTEEADRLNRRLEMAMNEIRELKTKNADLAEQAKRSANAPAAAAGGANQFDWETQKRRLLEQLATSFDGEDAEQAKEKIRCEEVIRQTEQFMAQRNDEIADLHQQLMERPEPTASAKEAANDALLNGDDLIRAERERLASMQAEWQDKLRHAEVEISIERAKLARERLQLEEKLRTVSSTSPGETPAGGGTGESKSSKGKWLNRLGLGGGDK